jgi:hypothetical protein
MVALRGVFKWAASEELLPPSIWQGLQAVAGLREGQANREPLTHEAVAVKVLYHCGARPSELLTLRIGDIDRTGTIWVAHIERHKNRAKGKQRNLVFGAKSQALLAPMLLKPADAYIFTTAEVIAWRAAQCEVHRHAGQKPDPRKTDRTLSEFVIADALPGAVQLAVELTNAEPDRKKADKVLAPAGQGRNKACGRRSQPL